MNRSLMFGICIPSNSVPNTFEECIYFMVINLLQPQRFRSDHLVINIFRKRIVVSDLELTIRSAKTPGTRTQDDWRLRCHSFAQTSNIGCDMDLLEWPARGRGRLTVWGSVKITLNSVELEFCLIRAKPWAQRPWFGLYNFVESWCLTLLFHDKHALDLRKRTE